MKKLTILFSVILFLLISEQTQAKRIFEINPDPTTELTDSEKEHVENDDCPHEGIVEVDCIICNRRSKCKETADKVTGIVDVDTIICSQRSKCEKSKPDKVIEKASTDQRKEIQTERNGKVPNTSIDKDRSRRIISKEKDTCNKIDLGI